jgi:uncharacterized protein (DUF885 family)
MRAIAFAASIALALAAACSGTAPPRTTRELSVTERHQAFAELEGRFLYGFFAGAPTEATRAGDHHFDAAWPDVSEAGQAARRAFLDQTLRELAVVDRDHLDAQDRIDAAIIENTARYMAFELDERAPWERDPMAYTTLLGDGLDPLVTRTFAPPEARAADLRARLRGVPAIVEVAKKRLGARAPAVATETAMRQAQGLVDLCEHDLGAMFPTLGDADKAPLFEAASAAAASLRELADFLEKDLLPRSKGDFRLGRALFEKKLRFELDDAVDVDAIAKGARELLTKTQGEMFDTAKQAWPVVAPGQPMPATGDAHEQRAFVRRVLDLVAARHPTNATIVGDAKTWLDKATKFVAEHQLVTLPKEPCGVIEMPEYRRGFSVAYCDASGPLEQKPETFFAIAPTPADWPAPRVDSFYREYNASMLADLTVHEAMPGHFLQLMHNNRFPSKLRGVLASGSFVEGWAVYAEWLMSKHGFGGPEVTLMRQKMVLRLSVNALLDHGVHAGNMSEKEAIDLMMNDAFQEEGEAVGKWKRACLSSAQLTTYYFGFSEMMKLRAEAERSPGFAERAYHDRLLSFGSPPLRHVRALMR